MALSNQTGILFIISGPSGSGKTTVCQRLLANHQESARVITCTTRAPRPGEANGREYRFFDDEEFDRRLAAGEFLEWATTYGKRYGSLIADYAAAQAEHPLVFVVLDEVGVKAARLKLTDLRTIGLGCSLETLKKRMATRQLPADEAARRLSTYHQEMAFAVSCDFTVMNEDGRLDATMASIERYLLNWDDPVSGPVHQTARRA